MKKVLIPTKLNKVAADFLTAHGFEVVQDADTDLLTQAKNNSDAVALIVRSEKVTPEIIDLLPNLKCVVRAGAGFNTIDIKYARKKNVDVMNTPGANSNAVAEEVVAVALAAYRHLVQGDVTTRAGGWEKKKFMGHELTGKTIGIVGLGNIGQLVRKRLSGFDMTFLGYDPIINAAKAEELGVKLVSLPELFAKADIITLHIPENDETRGMINAELLKNVKTGCMLINCARAGIVNEADLRAAKAEKQLLYCNDVYPKDEAGPKSIADIADVMLPHLGANTTEANFNAAKRAGEQTVAYFEQGINTFVVNKALPDGLNENFQKLAYCLAKIARSYIGREAPVNKVRCSFYGDLSKFAKWFMSPICAALSDHFEYSQGPEEAKDFLQEKGIEYVVEATDESKLYGNAMTIDVFSDGQKASIRGTVTENNLLVSRVNEFNHLYFIPKGNATFVEYIDRPGVLAQITSAIAASGMNIEDIHSPHAENAVKSLATIITDKPLPPAVLEHISKMVNPVKAFSLSL